MLADSHCHLDWFKNPSEMVQKALSAGVSRILSNSTSSSNLASTVGLLKFPSVRCAIGLHPVDLLSLDERQIEDAFGFISKNLHNACAIGEVGMDFKRAQTLEQRSLQEGVFRRFIGLAIEHDKPIVVHARYAETQCLDILESMGAKKVHMHWFTNSKKTCTRAVSLGYYISCGPIISIDPASAQIVAQIPLENLLLETDAPVEFGGRESDPSWILQVCEKVAQIKGLDKSEVEERTWKNFTGLFGD